MSSGSCTSSTWVGSHPPSPKKVTRKCGAVPCAKDRSANDQGMARSAALETPILRSDRRVSSSSHSLRMTVPFPKPLVEEDLGATQHGGEHPAPRALALAARDLARVRAALRRVVVEILEEIEPHRHL